jgi:MoxR-like ATPase
MNLNIMNEQTTSTVAGEKVRLLIDNIEKVIKGKHRHIQYIVTALLAKGHILLEDNPGAGKTVLAKTLALSITGDLHSNNNKEGHLGFKRVQFTPDLLPMDLLGTNVFDENTKDFIFRKGPLFTNVLLADEINRASPKVQSALLECMAENQITVGEKTYKLDKLFFTIATQNPIESEGTYPLPQAQLDRFFMKISLGYVTDDVELDIYKDYLNIIHFENDIKQVLRYEDLLELQAEAEKVFVHDEILKAVRNIITETRRTPEILIGASTRSGIIFLKTLKAFALVNGRNFVTEEDIANLSDVVINHRLLFKNRDAQLNALKKIVQKEVDRLAKLKIIYNGTESEKLKDESEK